jgi:hypothetical protein
MKTFHRMRAQLGALLVSGLLALASFLPAAVVNVGAPTAAIAISAAALAPTTAEAALTLSTTARSDMMSALLPHLAGGTIRLYNGSKPASLGTPSGTLLATLTMGSPAGTVSSGVLTIGSVTQSNGSHVNGTPTFIRFSTSGGTAVADIDIGAGAGNVQFTGTVVTGQNVTVTGLTLTAPNR